MKEEADTGQTGTESEGQHEQEVHQPTIEEIAKAIGYRSKEEMKDPTKHVDAAEYIKRTAKFNEDYRKEIKNLKRSQDGIAATIQQIAADKFAEGVRAAEAKLAEAKAAYDPDAIEAAAHEVREAKQKAAQVATVPATDQAEIDAFCERNTWFDTNKTMRTDALEYREKFVKRNPDATTAEVLEYVETKIKKDYPDKFKATEPAERKQSPAGPEGVKNNNTGAAALWEKQEKELSDFERNTMNALCAQTHNGKPITTKKQYIESLAQSGRFGR
jgi:SOS-response transcriptional repressor LexA